MLTSLSLYNYILCLLLPFLAGSLFCLTSSFCFHLDGLSSSLSNLNLGLSIWMKWKPCKQRQFSSVTQSCLILCDPMNRSMPGLPVHHKRPEFTQTHAHRVGDAIQPSHPLSSPSAPAPNPSQHQGLFQWVNSSHEVVKKYWSFSFSISPSNEHPGLISFRMDWLDLLAVQGTLIIHDHWKNHSLDRTDLCWQSNVSAF